jgi:hypothetical protein
MSTKVEISIAGRGEADAPLLGDLIEQIQDYIAMVNAVAETVTGDSAQRFDWQVVGMSKNSPARMTLEAVPLPGHQEGPMVAARARDLTNEGLQELIQNKTRPVFFTDNVIDCTERFLTRITRGVAATSVGPGIDEAPPFTIRTPAAIEGLRHLAAVREADPVHPYTELGSFEGHIQNVGTDGYQRPYVVIKSRVTGESVRCILSGAALKALESEPVAKVVWRSRRVTATGILRYRTVGRLSTADVSKLDFEPGRESLPQLRDIIDPNFTDGLSSEEYLERLRNG